MFQTSTGIIQKRLGITVVTFGLFFSAMLPHVQAQTSTANEKSEQQRVMIAQLQETLLVLQRKQYESKHQKDTNIIHGNSYVKALQRVALYTTAGAKRVASKEAKGKGGEVTAGPRLINGEVWWKIDFEKGNEGWVKEKFLERIPSITIEQDTDGDGVKDTSTRVLGDYNTDRLILFPSSGGVSLVSIPEELQMIEKFDRAYRTGQLSDKIDGPVQILQSDPYISNSPFIKGKDTSVPIAWTTKNVPINSEIEIEVKALRLIDSSLGGGTWSAESLPGDTVGVYYYSIRGEGGIGAGDYRSQVRIKDCSKGTCKVIAESPFRYFSIRNK